MVKRYNNLYGNLGSLFGSSRARGQVDSSRFAGTPGNPTPMGRQFYYPELNQPPEGDGPPPYEAPEAFDMFGAYLAEQKANAARLTGAFNNWLPGHLMDYENAAKDKLKTAGKARGTSDTSDMIRRNVFGSASHMQGKTLRDENFKNQGLADIERQKGELEADARGRLSQSIGGAGGAYAAGLGAAGMSDMFNQQNMFNEYLSKMNDYWNKNNRLLLG